MVESDRSRSPRRQIQKPGGTIDQPCQSELGRSLETFLAAADRLLQLQLDGYSIPEEASSQCTALLKSALRQLWKVTSCKYSCITINWRSFSTARCFVSCPLHPANFRILFDVCPTNIGGCSSQFCRYQILEWVTCCMCRAGSTIHPS